MLHLGVRRARETAAHLGLAGASWVQDILLRERSWGRADFVMPESERYERFAEELAVRRQDPCYWRPREGESLADVYVRITLVLAKMGECSPDGTCILVTGGTVPSRRREPGAMAGAAPLRGPLRQASQRAGVALQPTRPRHGSVFRLVPVGAVRVSLGPDSIAERVATDSTEQVLERRVAGHGRKASSVSCRVAPGA